MPNKSSFVQSPRNASRALGAAKKFIRGSDQAEEELITHPIAVISACLTPIGFAGGKGLLHIGLSVASVLAPVETMAYHRAKPRHSKTFPDYHCQDERHPKRACECSQ